MRTATSRFLVLSAVLVPAWGALSLACSDDDPTTPSTPDAGGTKSDGGAPDATTKPDAAPPPGDSGNPPDAAPPPTDSGDGGVDAGPARTVFGIDDSNQLVKFGSTSPGTVTKVAVTGATDIHGIDFRPSTGVLFAVSKAESKIYTLNETTGAATLITGTADAGGQAWTLESTATSLGFDFNPRADRIRVHTDTGQNYRLHPVDGLSVNAGDGRLSLEDGGVAKIVGTAYTNSVSRAPTATALYGIDAERDVLVTFADIPADAGGVTGGFASVRTVGALGVNAEGVAGFDIYGGVGGQADAGNLVDKPIEAYAALRIGGSLGLYKIDLATGVATSLGAIGHDKPLRGIAIKP